MSGNAISGTSASLEQFISAVDDASNHGKSRIIAEINDGQVQWHKEGRFEAFVRLLGLGPSSKKQNRAFVEAVQFLKQRATEAQWNAAAKQDNAVGGKIIRAVDTLNVDTQVAKRSTVVSQFLAALQEQGVSVDDVTAAKFQDSVRVTNPAHEQEPRDESVQRAQHQPDNIADTEPAPVQVNVQTAPPTTGPVTPATHHGVATDPDNVVVSNAATINAAVVPSSPTPIAAGIYQINYAQESRRIADKILNGTLEQQFVDDGVPQEVVDGFKVVLYRLLDRADQGADPQEIAALLDEVKQAAQTLIEGAGWSNSGQSFSYDWSTLKGDLEAILAPPVVNARPPNVLPSFVTQQGENVVVTSTVGQGPNQPTHPLTTPSDSDLAFIKMGREENLTREDLVQRLPVLQRELQEQGPSQFRTIEDKGFTHPRITPGQSMEEINRNTFKGTFSEIAYNYKDHAFYGEYSFDSSSHGFVFGKRVQTSSRDAGNKFHISVPPGQYKEALDVLAPLLGSPDNPFLQWKVTNPSSTRPTSHVHAAEQFTLYATPEPDTWESHKQVGRGRDLDAGRYSASLIKRQADFILAIEERLAAAGIGVQDVPASDVRAPHWQYASYSNDTRGSNYYVEAGIRQKWTADQAQQPYYQLVSQVTP